MIFFTSDTHFSHKNIIQYCNRPFANIHEMNKKIISNWNEVVSKDDIVYHIGDFALTASLDVIKSIIKSLNGKIILIFGNHDKRLMKEETWKYVGFERAYGQYVIDVDGIKVFLSHRPQAFERWKSIADAHICGHVHEKWSYNKSNRACNVCVDVTNFYPVQIEDALFVF